MTPQDSGGGATLKLGSVALNANFVSAAVTVPATMVASGATVVLTLGTRRRRARS